MFDTSREKPISLNVARFLPDLQRNGKPPSLSRMYKLIDPGIRGIRLEVLVQPRGYATSAEAVERFIARLSGVEGPAIRTSTQRKRDLAEADRVLAGAGF